MGQMGHTGHIDHMGEGWNARGLNNFIFTKKYFYSNGVDKNKNAAFKKTQNLISF
jgi:hypothetical protein